MWYNIGESEGFKWTLLYILHIRLYNFHKIMIHFCADFSIWLKVPKMRQYFVVFCAIWRSYKVVTIVTKDLQKKVKLVTAPEKRVGRSPTILYTHTYISIYTYKGAAKGAASGAALGSCILELRCRCGSYVLPLPSCKSLDFKNSVFFLFNKKSYF